MVAREMHNAIMEIVGRYPGATQLGLISERIDIWINQEIKNFTITACSSKRYDLIDTIIVSEDVVPKQISSNKFVVDLRANLNTSNLVPDKTYIVSSPILVYTDDTTLNDYLNSHESVDSEFMIISNPSNVDLSSYGSDLSEVGTTFICTKNFSGLTSVKLGRVLKQNDIFQFKNTTIISGEVYVLSEGITNYRVHQLIEGALNHTVICNSKPSLMSKDLNIRPINSINTDKVNPFVTDNGMVYTTKFDSQLVLYPTVSGVKTVRLTYVRYPAVVKLETETSPGSNNCDLPELYHSVICEKAAEVIIKKFNLKSDTQ